MDNASKMLNELSAIAEPSFKEYKTTEYIIDFLKKNNIPIDKELKTGCFGTINVGAEKTIAIRADIDALPADSKNSVYKHLCGHHAHTTGLLLALQNINLLKEKLKFNIRYIFQPAEETVNGAKFMIENGAIKGVDAVFALHGDPTQKLGEICIKDGELMAGAALFNITLSGKSTHAAFPQYGSDVIVAISDYINLCQKIISRYKDPIETAVISFTTINGGYAKNILPESVEASGTIRFFNEDIKKLLQNEMANILKNIENIYKINGELDFTSFTAPVINNIELARKLKPLLKKEFKVIENYNKMMGSEDFSEFIKEIPGVYLIVGIAKDDNHPPLHNKDFFVPYEAVLIYKKLWELIAFNLLLG